MAAIPEIKITTMAPTKSRSGKRMWPFSDMSLSSAVTWFVKELEGKPKKAVQIWYLSESSDGLSFAMDLVAALSEANWVVTDVPAPIPEPQPPLKIGQMVIPKAMAAGGQQGGVTVVSNKPIEQEIEDGTAAKALGMAILKGMEQGQVNWGTNSTVPDGMLRIVISAKPDANFVFPAARDGASTPVK